MLINIKMKKICSGIRSQKIIYGHLKIYVDPKKIYDDPRI